MLIGRGMPRYAQRSLRRLKLAAMSGAEKLGAFSLALHSSWRTRQLLILCYHGVSLADEHECSDEHVSVEHLRRRFEVLRDEGCAVLPLDEAVERLSSRDLPPRSVVLTFDDGLYDFKAQAYPLLQEFGYHGTVYVATYYCDFPGPVFDVALQYLLWKARGRPADLSGVLGEKEAVVVPVDESARQALTQRMRKWALDRGYSAYEKNESLRSLCLALGIDWTAFVASRINQLMRPAELSSLDHRWVSVQLHTHRHRTPRDETLFNKEINDNLAALERMGCVRSGLRHFCYPSGDTDPMFPPLLHSLGVRTATTCEVGLANSSSSRLLLPRVIDTMGMSETEFRGWLSGIAGLLPRRG